jgi:hypothetical protein
MKSIKIVLIIVMFHNLLYSQQIDTVFLRGYYIVCYEQNQIHKNKPNEHYLTIDHEYKEFFLNICGSAVHAQYLDLSKCENILIESRKEWTDIMKDNCNIKFVVDSNGTHKNESYYYLAKKQKKFRHKYFQIFYTEGWFYNIELSGCVKDILAKKIINEKKYIYIPFKINILCENREYLTAFRRVKF